MAELSFEERLAILVYREVLYRENRRLTRSLKAARLRVGACVGDIDYRHPRGLDKSRMASLIGLHWIRQSLHLCLTGPTGSGKTWLACALGNEACRRGFSVGSLRLPGCSKYCALPTDHWHEYIGEATIADAILDRLLHGAHRLNFTGESMRKVSANLTDRDRSV